MAELCGLPRPGGADTIRRWEVSRPTGPVAERLEMLALASERCPILGSLNAFDRFDIAERDSPARWADPRQDA